VCQYLQAVAYWAVGVGDDCLVFVASEVSRCGGFFGEHGVSRCGVVTVAMCRRPPAETLDRCEVGVAGAIFAASVLEQLDVGVYVSRVYLGDIGGVDGQAGDKAIYDVLVMLSRAISVATDVSLPGGDNAGDCAVRAGKTSSPFVGIIFDVALECGRDALVVEEARTLFNRRVRAGNVPADLPSFFVFSVFYGGHGFAPILYQVADPKSDRFPRMR